MTTATTDEQDVMQPIDDVSDHTPMWQAWIGIGGLAIAVALFAKFITPRLLP